VRERVPVFEPKKPFVFDLQLFADDDDEAKKQADAAKAKADADAVASKKKTEDDRAEAERLAAKDEAESDLSKKTLPEVIEYNKALRAKADRYYTRAKTAEAKADSLQKEKDDAEAQKLASDKKFEQLFQSEKQRREKAEADAAEKERVTNQRLVLAQVKDAAKEAGLKNPKIIRVNDLAELKINDDGTVDDREVVKFVRSLKADYPESFAEAAQTDTDKNKGKTSAEIDAERAAKDKADAEERERDEDRRRKANGGGGKDGSIDWSKLTPEQMDLEEKKFLKNVSKI
jgi:hypothetical protein